MSSGFSYVDCTELSHEQVLSIIPHRPPFLFIDRVLEIKKPSSIGVGMDPKAIKEARKGTIVRAVRTLSVDEDFFKGHFPGNPIFPGVLSIEAMAQTAVFSTVPFLAAMNNGELPKLGVALTGVEDARFRKPIVPGDRLEIKVTVLNVRDPIWWFEGEISVNGEPKKAAEAKFMAFLEEKGNK
ncbi:MAG: 3-hydroxyacyl-ACP dehydratase FabZ [Bacteriovoracia bacterium]